MDTPDAPQTPSPNRFDAATIALMVGTAFSILSPFLTAAGVWIQAHSLVTFTDDYLRVLESGIATLATTIAVYRHGATR